MLTGDEIRRARQRAGWSQGALAQRLGVAQRTVGNWERGDTSPSQKETVVRSVLSGYMDGDVQESTSLRHSSDAELLAEVARRLEKARKRPQQPQQDLWAGGVDVGHHAIEVKTAQRPTPAESQEDHELAASYGDEGVAPDEDPHTT